MLVSPSRAFDGEWISTFSPGTPFAIGVAVEQLTEQLPDGHWFEGNRLSRDFSSQPRTRKPFNHSQNEQQFTKRKRSNVEQKLQRSQ